MKSMTGYGTARIQKDGVTVQVEIFSVNKKGLELFINSPRELSSKERVFKELIEKKIQRGRVNLNIQVFQKKAEEKDAKLPIDEKVLKSYVKQMKAIGKKVGLSGDLEWEDILVIPGLFQFNPKEDREKEWGDITVKAVEKALQQFVVSREREGQFLAKEILGKFKMIDGIVTKVKKIAPRVVEAYRNNLRDKISNANLPLPATDDFIRREILLFTDRSDISEELTRLDAHLKEANRLMKSKETVGRNLDFLLQEINREVNTTGSKANNLEISQHVVLLKTELEKIREQVQNIE
jgi:uncharacterized protein (TIGR00255 family)